MASSCLALFREHTMKGFEVRLEGDDIVFTGSKDGKGGNEKRLNKKTKTNYQSKKGDKFYDLFAIYTCLKYSDLVFREYMKKTKEEEADMVSTIDKKIIISYLRGEIDSTPQFQDPSKQKEQAAPESSAKTKETGVDKSSRKRKVEEETKTDSRKPRKPRTEPAKAPLDPIEKESIETIKRIMSHEVLQRSRQSILCNDKKSFENVLTLLMKNLENMRKAGPKVAVRTNSTPIKKVTAASLETAFKKFRGLPIILAPSGTSDVLSMLNIEDFLQNNKYVPGPQKKKEGGKKQRSLTLKRTFENKEFTFEVLDNVNRFGSKDWERVVAVIVSGATWQFKGWKWKFPVETFNKVLGVHAFLHGTELKAAVKTWNVKMVPIHPDKRHLDNAGSSQFWEHLFTHLKQRYI